MTTKFKQPEIKNFAIAAADAYVNQYLTDHPVMGQPIIIYNQTTGRFDWQSNLTPLNDNEILIETLEENCYGETGDDPEVAYESITRYIQDQVDWGDVMDKIEGNEPEGY